MAVMVAAVVAAVVADLKKKNTESVEEIALLRKQFTSYQEDFEAEHKERVKLSSENEALAVLCSSLELQLYSRTKTEETEERRNSI